MPSDVHSLVSISIYQRLQGNAARLKWGQLSRAVMLQGREGAKWPTDDRKGFSEESKRICEAFPGYTWEKMFQVRGPACTEALRVKCDSGNFKCAFRPAGLFFPPYSVVLRGDLCMAQQGDRYINCHIIMGHSVTERSGAVEEGAAAWPLGVLPAINWPRQT